MSKLARTCVVLLAVVAVGLGVMLTSLVSCLGNRLNLRFRLAIILYYGKTSESH